MTGWPAIVVFGALPTVGLVAGPSYAALVFGLAIVQLAQAAVIERRSPFVSIDPALCLLAAAMATLCWVSSAWSLDPARSLHGAMQVTIILLGALALLAGPPLTEATTELLFRTLVVATMAGAAILATDFLLGYRFQALVSGRLLTEAATKYNRGIDYLVLLSWPQFGFLAQRRMWRHAALLALCMVVILAIGASLAARVAALAGILALLLAFWLPRAVAPILAGGTAALVSGLPFVLRVLADNRTALAVYLKPSGLHRLEIWDYMTARVFEHPLLGWGIAVANAVPISQDELSHYVMQHDRGIYPHNQWLELWIETGAAGAAIGVALALLVVHRIRRLAAPSRPFAYATFASAVAVASVNFEVMTDSWWAALAASAYLLALLGHRAAPS